MINTMGQKLTPGLYGDVQASLPFSVHQEIVISISKRPRLHENMPPILCNVCNTRLWGIDGEGACLQGKGAHTPPERLLPRAVAEGVLQHAAV